MDLMMLLEADAFTELSGVFKQREEELGGGLPLLEFIDLMLPRMPKPRSLDGTCAAFVLL